MLPLVAWLVVSTPGADWPRFLGPTDDGRSPETGILTAWPRGGLKKLWDCPLGLGYAPPAIVARRVYHFDRFGNKNRLTCRNSETGELVWKYETSTDYEDYYGYDPGPRAGPVVDGDRVYCYGPEGKLSGLSTADGSLLWEIDTARKYHVHQNFFGVGSAPVVEGDLLIVAVGGSPPGPRPADFRQVRGHGTAIVAFDKRTGEQRYALGDELASYSSPVVATMGGQRIGLYFARGGLLGFDPTAGKELFHYPWRARLLESVNASNPVIMGDKILLTECYEKGSVCLQWRPPGALQHVWSDADADRLDKALMGHWCTPVSEKGFVYGCSGRHTSDAELRCIDGSTGEVKWRERRTTRATLTLIDGHLLMLGETGELRLVTVSPERYHEVARWQSPDLEYPAWAPPAVSDGRLYVRGKDKLVCYELIPSRSPSPSGHSETFGGPRSP